MVDITQGSIMINLEICIDEIYKKREPKTVTAL